MHYNQILMDSPVDLRLTKYSLTFISQALFHWVLLGHFKSPAVISVHEGGACRISIYTPL